MKEPHDLVQRLEKNRELPRGEGEILSVYGVESCPFASGDLLCSRHVIASSFGPVYTAIWHRDRGGDWHFYQNAPPRQGCPRFFGAALAGVTVLPIETRWEGPRRLHVIGGGIDWQFDLRSTLATRAMNLMGSVMPERMWKSPALLAAIAPVAGVVLGAGKLRLTGRAPNGQRFIANPLLTWTIPTAKATIDGRNLGAVVPLQEQTNLGDFWIPRTGLFAIGRAFFDAFDPNIHSVATTRNDAAATDDAALQAGSFAGARM